MEPFLVGRRGFCACARARTVIERPPSTLCGHSPQEMKSRLSQAPERALCNFDCRPPQENRVRARDAWTMAYASQHATRTDRTHTHGFDCEGLDDRAVKYGEQPKTPTRKKVSRRDRSPS